MTRDDARAKCIKTMVAAYCKAFYGDIDMTTLNTGIPKSMTAAFDSLHGIATVNPIEATEEMLLAGRHFWTGVKPEMWAAMAAAGDLTNSSEKKP